MWLLIMTYTLLIIAHLNYLLTTSSYKRHRERGKCECGRNCPSVLANQGYPQDVGSGYTAFRYVYCWPNRLWQSSILFLKLTQPTKLLKIIKKKTVFALFWIPTPRLRGDRFPWNDGFDGGSSEKSILSKFAYYFCILLGREYNVGLIVVSCSLSLYLLFGSSVSQICEKTPHDHKNPGDFCHR